MPLRLTLDYQQHRYYLEGVEIPGVSHILDWAGIDKISYPEGDYKERGTAVHKATLLHDNGKKIRIASSIEGYLESYLKFCSDFHVKWTHLEYSFYNSNPVYAGTLDRAALHDLILADIKTGMPPKKRLGLQTAAYTLATFNGKHRDVKRLGVELDSAGGKYRLHVCDDPADFDVWIGLVHRYWWEKRK